MPEAELLAPLELGFGQIDRLLPDRAGLRCLPLLGSHVLAGPIVAQEMPGISPVRAGPDE